MLFTSPNFAIFFVLVYLFVFILNKVGHYKKRNFVLLAASYAFYGLLNAYYPLLLVYVTLVNYVGGRVLPKCLERTGRIVVAVIVVFSLIPLVGLKYAPLYTDDLWLPVGLSFFTFQALTYTIDVYRKKIEGKQSLAEVALFVAFFPTLLSGPIERARNIIPQLRGALQMNWCNLTGGAQVFIWGLFKKIVVADRLAEWVNTIYGQYEQGGNVSGGTLAVAAVLYSFQIYCDFSGYASMAIGSGRMLGLRIMENFNFPYFAASFKDFWRRWHISLTSWFTEYVYISLGGNRVALWRWILNISVVFILSGVWHGATWAFLIWGAMHAIMYLAEHFIGIRDKWGIYRVFVFLGVTLAWVFFRVEDSSLAASMIGKMFVGPWLPIQHGAMLAPIALVTLAMLAAMVCVELAMYHNCLPKHWIWKLIGFSVLIICISLFATSSEQFVYFKF